MRITFVAFLVIAACSAEWHAWKPGALYKYELRGRTVAGLHQVSNQFSGILIKGHVTIQAYGENTLNVKLSQVDYADLHANLSSGWATNIPDGKLSFKQLPLSSKPFELKLKNGIVDKIIVDKSLPTWEVNILKGIASQLQVDTQAENLKNSRINHLSADKNQVMGVYKTMEDSVTGKCETIYDISPLPSYVTQSKPALAPMPHLRGDGQLIDIVKTKNFSNCDQRMAYHFGITGLTNWEPASTQMGNFLSRGSVQRVVISGNLNRYTIQSSVTTGKIVIAPHLHNEQKGIVASRINMTLTTILSTTVDPQTVQNPRVLKSLVYDYNAATQDEKSQKLIYSSSNSDCSPGSSDSSDCVQSPESHSWDSFLNNYASIHKAEVKKLGRSKRSLNNNPKSKLETIKILRKNKTKSSSSSSDNDSSSSSWSSSEAYMQPKPSLDLAPNSPFLPYFIGYRGNSIQASQTIDGVQAILKLAQQVASEIQTPNGITGQQTLTTFNIMSRVIRTMNYEQIKQATNQLYFPRSKADSNSKNDALKYLAWACFRDAVAQAGTGPALLTLKDWIQNDKVQNEVAAELIAVLPNTARYPTEEYIKTVFQIASSPKAIAQDYLNSTAIIAVTNLIRKAIVSNSTIHNRFPVHTYGRPVSKKAQQVLNTEYIPYLAGQLQNAVQTADSHKIQVYIRALGNIGHPNILNVFEPYLEGKKEMSTFQRLVIVASLDHMTKTYPNLVRPVLYRIYQNSGEANEVRVAAVMQLMNTDPPIVMLQRMAQYTNSEHSKQVNSAVKSAIESAAQQTHPELKELARKAKSAVNLLTPYQYGFQYSKNYFRSYIDQQITFGYSSIFTSIQSSDSVIPSSLLFTLRKHMGGSTVRRIHCGLMTSSSDDLLDLLADQFSKYESQNQKNSSESHPDTGSTWTADKIANMLDIEVDDAEQVEGNVMISWAGGRRIFTFDNQTIQQLPTLVKDAASSLSNSKGFNYTKFHNKKTVKIGFPTAMGLPFSYSYQVPTLLSLGGEASLKSNPDLANGANDEIRIPRTLNLTTDIKITYASKTQSKLGFTTPFNNQRYLAGYDSNTQITLPLSVTVDVDVENTRIWAEFQPLYPDRYQKIAEYSTTAYTTKHDILNLQPPQMDDNSKIIHVRPVKKFQMTAGQQSTGFAFDLQAETQQKHFDLAYFMNGAQRHDILSAFLYYNKGQIIVPYTNYTLAFNPSKTTAKSAKLNINYNETNMGNDNIQDNQENSQMPTNSKPESQSRIQQLLKTSSSGIQNAVSQAIDLSVEFKGESNANIVLTGAYSRSPLSQMSRYLLFMARSPAKISSDNKPYQIAVNVTSKSPNVPLLHFRKAFEASPTSYVNAQINFGEQADSGGYIKIKTDLKQTNEYKDNLEKISMSIECEKQMLRGNNILPECRNVTARANFLDQYSLTAEYEKVPQIFKNLTYRAYSVLREMSYPYVSENIIDHGNPSGKLKAEVKYSSDLKSVNVSIQTPIVSSIFSNLPVEPLTRAVGVVHPEYDVIDRLGQWGLLSQQYPTCAVDKTYATTLDNKTYPINIGKCWHAIVQSTSQTNGDSTSSKDSQNISILVRDVESNQREVMLIIGEVIITLQPDSGSSADYFIVNGNKYKVSKESMGYFEDEEGNRIVEAYKIPTGTLRVYTPQLGFELLYDGLRIKLQAPNRYRGDIRGMCGTFDGEKSTDFKSPKNCILKDPLEFAASYSIADGSCQGPAKDLKQKALKSSCYKQTVLLGDIISDNEPECQANYEKQINPHPKYLKMSKSQKIIDYKECEIYKSRIIDVGGLKCFSKEPQLSCMDQCNRDVQKVEKQVDFYCIPESVHASRTAGIINLGASPDFTDKETTLTKAIWVPASCSQLKTSSQ